MVSYHTELILYIKSSYSVRWRHWCYWKLFGFIFKGIIKWKLY